MINWSNFSCSDMTFSQPPDLGSPRPCLTPPGWGDLILLGSPLRHWLALLEVFHMLSRTFFPCNIYFLIPLVFSFWSYSVVSVTHLRDRMDLPLKIWFRCWDWWCLTHPDQIWKVFLLTEPGFLWRAGWHLSESKSALREQGKQTGLKFLW